MGRGVSSAVASLRRPRTLRPGSSSRRSRNRIAFGGYNGKPPPGIMGRGRPSLIYRSWVTTATPARVRSAWVVARVAPVPLSRPGDYF